MKRSAFTLIELIFTILILGFIATGLPMILATDMDAREESLVQEAIYAATAKMSQIISYKWDEANNEDNVTISGAKVLDIPVSANTDSNLSRIGVTKFRAGHFQTTGRRSMYSQEINASTLQSDAGDGDDIDDFIVNNSQLLSGSTSAGGYKEDYVINISVSYIIDKSNSTNGYENSEQNGFEFENPVTTLDKTNIKSVVVDVLGTNNERLFTLRTYSSNIGESSISSRVFN